MRMLSAAVLFFCACGGEYDVRLQVVPPELIEEASAIEVAIVPSCEGELDEGPVLGSPLVRFAPTDSPPALGNSETGARGLYARLVNDRCEVVASGCSPVNLSAGGSDILRVIARATSGNACTSGELCRQGVCSPGEGVDSGVDAVQVPDASVDADPSDGAFEPDAGQDGGPDAGPLPVDTTCWLNEGGCDWSASFNLELMGSSGLPAGAGNTAFTPNGCGLLFSLSGDLFIVRRSEPGGVFGSPEELAELNSSVNEDKVIFAPGELEAFVIRPVGDDSFVFRATRLTTSADFGALSLVPALNRVAFDSYDISLSGDALRLYMARPRDAVSAQDILVATRASRLAEFGEPVVVGEISETEFGEAEPVVSADGRTMVLATTREGDASLRLYYTTRGEPSEVWGPLTTLPGAFLAEANEREGALSPDACELVVNRSGGSTRLVYSNP